MSETSADLDQVGLRNQLRGRWRQLTDVQRVIVVAAIELVAAALLYSVDHALASAVLILGGLFATRRLPLLPTRLILQGGIIVLLAILAAVGSTPWSLVILLAVACATLSVPGGRRRWVLPVIALLGAVLYPFYVDNMFTIPIFGAWPDVPTGVYMLVFIIMAVGLNIVVGYAGLLDLGYVAFYATGAYTMAWFTSEQFAGVTWHFGAVGIDPKLPGIHLSAWLLLPVAGALTALFGIVIGLPTLRLRGDYLAIVTLGFGEILPQIARNGDSLFGYNVTNGPNGITPLDSPGFGHGLSHLTGGFLPANYLQCCAATLNVGFLHIHHQVDSDDVYFWTGIVLLLFTVFCSFRLQFSRLGRAWIAIREDETAAGAMGIPLMRTKTWAYASGAFFGGVAGAFYAIFKSATFPGDFFFNISVFILCMVILGGMGNIWGVIVGAGFLAYLNQAGLGNTGFWLSEHVHLGSHHLKVNLPLYASGIYGIIILVVMLLRPEGLIPSSRRAMELHDTEQHDQPAYGATHAAGAE
jgi:branched-chain amino acid transport system permease protein